MATAISHRWEETLLTLSREAEAPEFSVRVARVGYARSALEQAYDRCDAITRDNSRTFSAASGLLRPSTRRAIRALYAFCRTTDDIVDSARGGADAESALEAWRSLALDPAPPIEQPVAVAWAATRAMYGIPRRYAEQLIDGVGRDLRQSRYRNFEELTTYAYGVASTVGLMSMRIIGCVSPAAMSRAIPYAVKLGVALQLTNILRDVGEDWLAGRLYLPLDELARYRLTEEDVRAGRVNDRWRAFMRFQIARNRQLYAEAWPGIGLLSRDGRFAIAAAAELYRAILGDIERNGYDVFNRRAHVGSREKLLRLALLRWRESLLGLRQLGKGGRQHAPL